MCQVDTTALGLGSGIAWVAALERVLAAPLDRGKERPSGSSLGWMLAVASELASAAASGSVLGSALAVALAAASAEVSG